MPERHSSIRSTPAELGRGGQERRDLIGNQEAVLNGQHARSTGHERLTQGGI